MSQPTSNNPQINQNLADLIRQRALDLARRFSRQEATPAEEAERPRPRYADQAEAQLIRTLQSAQATYEAAQAQGEGHPSPTSYPRTAAQIAMERAQNERQLWEEQARQAGLSPQQQRAVNLTVDVQRELAADKQLQDIRLDPDVNRLAELFYTSLMRQIHFEFGQINPEWAGLGSREKILWLQAIQLVLDELQKTPIQNKGLAAIVNRRIITE